MKSESGGTNEVACKSTRRLIVTRIDAEPIFVKILLRRINQSEPGTLKNNVVSSNLLKHYIDNE